MLSTGQINDAFQQALGRSPTGAELSQYSSDSSLDGSAGQQSLISKLTGGNSGGSSVTDQVSSYLQPYIDAFNTANTQYQQGVSAYDKSNPFSFDDMLAKETANVTPAISAYYNQQLGNYMKGINIQRQQSLDDENRTVTQLLADRDAYTGQAKAELNTALTQAGQQYSDAGSYDSGARARAQGVQEANTAYNIAQNERQANYNVATQRYEGNLLRNVQLPYQTGVTEQNTARQQAADIAQEANINATYAQDLQKYNEANAGIANVQGGQYQAQGAFPGQSYATTQNTLFSMLPNVPSGLTAPLGV